jgi:hypothetical protein
MRLLICQYISTTIKNMESITINDLIPKISKRDTSRKISRLVILCINSIGKVSQIGINKSTYRWEPINYFGQINDKGEIVHFTNSFKLTRYTKLPAKFSSCIIKGSFEPLEPEIVAQIPDLIYRRLDTVYCFVEPISKDPDVVSIGDFCVGKIIIWKEKKLIMTAVSTANARKKNIGIKRKFDGSAVGSPKARKKY